MHGHLTRAACCRVRDELSKQFQHMGLHTYQLHHPFVGRVKLYRFENFDDKFPHDSINWCLGDGATEIVTALTGKETNRYSLLLYVMCVHVDID